MDVFLFVGFVNLLYGVAGLAGWQFIPFEFRGHSWTKRYTRLCGVSWLLLGGGWLLFPFAADILAPSGGSAVGLALVLGLPAIVYSALLNQHYAKKLDEDDPADPNP